eukprot:Nitzschia sp. Nitz4//scaffold12_size214221//78391//81058//NITZ4_001496-RA/size214221-augustus-gene-0.6-mRNA-1//1//CDS//3329535008//1405//frame0
MYSLHSLGTTAETIFGSQRFLAIYLASGVAGNLVGVHLLPNPGLGASGAVFGVMASFLVFVGRNQAVLGTQLVPHSNMLLRTLMFNLVMGAMNPRIDNYSHIGGAAAGAAISFLFGPRYPLDLRAATHKNHSARWIMDFCFEFRDKSVSITSLVPEKETQLALKSEIFQTWVRRCQQVQGSKRIELEHVEIQSVDMFGSSRVGFLKLKAEAYLLDESTGKRNQLPGICFLRGGSVAILVALIGADQTYSLLVDQPRIPIGQVSCLELPAGMIDSVNDGVSGTAAKEMEEECGIKLRPSELVDLTELACQDAVKSGHLPCSAVPPSPGGSDEFLRYMYYEVQVSDEELKSMQGRLTGLQDEGEVIILKVVPMDSLWRLSGDNKAITIIPTVGFGLYQVAGDDTGTRIVLDAIAAGYRHFDTASYYGNEFLLGEALKRTWVPRHEFFVCSKVWNDVQKDGPEAVRLSVRQSLMRLDCHYIDIMYVHWPVPGCFVETYKVLEELVKEGVIRGIGLSNFTVADYSELMAAGISIQPVANQLEISPYMYRPETISFFQDRGVTVVASKSLNRTAGLDHHIIQQLASKHNATPAQIALCWALGKKIVVIPKSSNPQHMQENRRATQFTLDEEDIAAIDALTTPEALSAQKEKEIIRKNSV